jgi:hypothetical protein
VTLSRGSIADHYRDCDDRAIEALQSAWQVTIVDPVWGREECVWRVLDAFTGRS